MSKWTLIATEQIDVPVRAPGNKVETHTIPFEIFKDGELYKTVPLCDEEFKRIANLKEELTFKFRPDKAVSTNGILDANQHIVEQVGNILREKGLAH